MLRFSFLLIFKLHGICYDIFNFILLTIKFGFLEEILNISLSFLFKDSNLTIISYFIHKYIKAKMNSKFAIQIMIKHKVLEILLIPL